MAAVLPCTSALPKALDRRSISLSFTLTLPSKWSTLDLEGVRGGAKRATKQTIRWRRGGGGEGQRKTNAITGVRLSLRRCA